MAHNKIEWKVERSPLPFTCTFLPLSTSLPDSTHIISDKSVLVHCYRPNLTLGFNLGIVHPLDLDKCIVAWFYHYNITWNIFTALKILHSLPLHSSFHTLIITDLTLSMAFSFPKMSFGKIIQYVSFL